MKFERAMIGVSLAVAAAIPVLQFALLFPLTSEMPTWDQWSEVPVWRAHFANRPVLSLLLSPYNGHFNVVPRLFFFGAGLLTHWNLNVEVISSYVVLAGALAILIFMLRETSPALLLFAAPLSAYVFSIVQYENFLSGYPFGQNLAILATVLAVFLLTRPSVSNLAFLLATSSALVASLSYGAANSLWIVGLCVLATEPRRSWFRLVTWLMAAAVGILAAGVAAIQLHAESIEIDARAVIRSFFAVTGQAWTSTPTSSVRTAVAAGAILIVLFFVFFVRALLQGRERFQLVRPWLALGLLSLGSAGMIALGRSGGSPRLAIASHYGAATVFVGIADLVLVALAVGTALRRPRARGLVLGPAAALSLALPVVLSLAWLPLLRSWAATERRDVEALVKGTATDAQIRESLFPVPARVRIALEVLRENHLAIYRR